MTPQTFCHASNRFTYVLVLFTVFSFCFTTVIAPQLWQLKQTVPCGWSCRWSHARFREAEVRLETVLHLALVSQNCLGGTPDLLSLIFMSVTALLFATSQLAGFLCLLKDVSRSIFSWVGALCRHFVGCP